MRRGALSGQRSARALLRAPRGRLRLPETGVARPAVNEDHSTIAEPIHLVAVQRRETGTPSANAGSSRRGGGDSCLHGESLRLDRHRHSAPERMDTPADTEDHSGRKTTAWFATKSRALVAALPVIASTSWVRRSYRPSAHRSDNLRHTAHRSETASRRRKAGGSCRLFGSILRPTRKRKDAGERP
jgi:hypothetical protein